MALEIIPYVLAIIIFYDFLLHLAELLLGRERAKKISWWPKFRTKGKFDRRKYTRFWTAYWGTVFILILIYIISLYR